MEHLFTNEMHFRSYGRVIPQHMFDFHGCPAPGIVPGTPHTTET